MVFSFLLNLSFLRLTPHKQF